MKAANQKSKIVIVVLVVIAVLLALWGVPRALVAMNANSVSTRETAERLSEAYQVSNSDKTAIDQKAVCRDLAYLSKLGLRADAIYGERDGRVVYLINMDLDGGKQYSLQVDVKTGWDGTIYYHTVDDGGDGTIVVRPWGARHIE